MFHRQAFASRKMSEEAQTALKHFIRVVNCVENSTLRERFFVWRQYTRRSYTVVKHIGCLVPKRFTGYLSWKREQSFSK
jgi:hypothetical protein